MDGFELNKIIAAILATVVVVFGINKVTDIIFTPDKPQQSAYKVEKIEPSLASASNTGQAAVGIKELLAMGTVEHGEKVFKRCSACHMIAAGGKNMIGPPAAIIWQALHLLKTFSPCSTVPIANNSLIPTAAFPVFEAEVKVGSIFSTL